MLTFFKSNQDDYFSECCQKRFLWQTENIFITQAERSLLGCLPVIAEDRILEAGAGTGSNLANLRSMGQRCSFTGLDINDTEVHFARHCFPEDTFIIGDATRMGLPSNTFDVVFCRDLLHHVPLSKQSAVIHDMVRVTRTGGTVAIMESNCRNPVIWLFARLAGAERNLRYSSPKRMVMLLKGIQGLSLLDPVPRFIEPCNLFRLLLHYRLGWPGLSRYRFVCRALEWLNQASRKVAPENRWAYMVFLGIKNR